MSIMTLPRWLPCVPLSLALVGCGPDDPLSVTTPLTQAIEHERGDDRDHGGPDRDDKDGWPQWARDGRHTGAVRVRGQRPNHVLANIVYDPFVPQEQAESGGTLVVHYQVPLVDGDDVFMEWKTGSFHACSPAGSGTPFPCGNNDWNTQIWNERRLHWHNGHLVQKWNFQTDWKPAPRLGWEPVFHALLSRGHVYVPGAGGTIFKIDRDSGHVDARLNPFSGVDPSIFVAGPPTADDEGNIYYNAIQLQLDPDPALLNPFGSPVVNSWLVKIDARGHARKATFASLTPGAPAATALCLGGFPGADRPWPPSPDAVPPSFPCGAQRPGINVAPAVGRDGTIYTVSRAHFNQNYGYVVAVNPNLTPKWTASLRDRLHNGCGVTVPIDDTPNGCRTGAHLGVDPRTNTLPAGAVTDLSSSTPVVAPDGSVMYGAFSAYNGFRGNLFKFSRTGAFQASYDFGWDTTPAIYAHDGTYSVILKDNHYFDTPGQEAGPFHITQLDANLMPEWRFTSTETRSCHREPDGTLSCVDDHPFGFEWCINAPAVDKDGAVYVNSEDGHLYVLNQGGTLKKRIFLQLALGAAYTPLSLGPDGLIYSQNAGRLFVVGR